MEAVNTNAKMQMAAISVNATRDFSQTPMGKPAQVNFMHIIVKSHTENQMLRKHL